MKTLDTNPEHGIALVADDDGRNYAYVPLAGTPPMTDDTLPKGRPQTYLGQMHYVAAHVAVGLQVHDRMGPNGEKPPKAGWTRWKNL